MFHTYKIDPASVPNAAPGMLRWFVGLDGLLKAKNEAGAISHPVPPIDPASPLDLTGVPANPAPVAGQVRVFGKSQASRIMLSMIGPSGLDTRLQPHLGANRVSMWMPNGAGVITATMLGGAWTASTLTASAMADTPMGRIRKANAATAATAASLSRVASEVAYSRNTGFHLIAHFAPYISGAVATRRFFCGMAAASPTNVALTGYAGVGVHADAGEATLKVRGANGVAVDLGAAFPAGDGNAWYRFEMFCAPFGESVGWQITHLITGETLGGEFTGDQLPAAGTFLSGITAMVTSAAAAQTFALGHHMIETDL